MEANSALRIRLRGVSLSTNTAGSTASAKVFAIPELLDHILADIDMKQLFVLQRVNSTFEAVISGSKQLRQNMWLERSPPSFSSKSDINPLALERGGSRILRPYRMFIERSGVLHTWGQYFLDVLYKAAAVPPTVVKTESWRKMQVCRPFEDRTPEFVAIQPGTYHHFALSLKNHTLGEVYEETVRITRAAYEDRQ
jgi:hypothetical protein